MIHAVFHHACSPWLRDRIASFEGDDLKIFIVEEADGEPLDRALETADVLLHVLQPVTAAMMSRAPALKLVQKIGVGLDAIDLDAARARNTAVCNMPGTNTQAVAELTLGLMLSVLRGIPRLDHRLRRQGTWPLPATAQSDFGEIGGKVVGLVGFGQVPQRLAPVLDALGAEVLVTSRRAVDPAVGRYATKDELLARCDILSLHMPGTAETMGWLDAGAIAEMKRGAIVINTARGSLIEEPALVRALVSGHLSGAGLDVFGIEPLPADADILRAPNVVTLPHAAWLTRETLDRSLVVAAENIRRLQSGLPLLNEHVARRR